MGGSSLFHGMASQCWVEGLTDDGLAVLDVGEGCLAGALARRGQLKGEGDMELRCTTRHGSSEGVREEQGKLGRCFLPVQIFGGERGNII